MTAHFTIHAGDTRPLLTVLEDELGPADLSGYDDVRFVLWGDLDAEPLIDASVFIVNAPVGEVRYDWAPGETDDRGKYKAVFRALDDQATPQQISFPSDRFLLVEII